MTTEVRELENDTSVEVNVMYFGIGQAYFSNKDGTIGGVDTLGTRAGYGNVMTLSRRTFRNLFVNF